MKNETVLFLGAHPDDEFGCSGTLARFADEGKQIYFAVFSTCEESLSVPFTKDDLMRELKNSLRIIGIKEANLIEYDFRVRHFPQFRQEILEKLIALRELIKPDIILLPALSDIHQDHNTLSVEGFRAFKQSSVLGYELPMNTVTFKHACFVKIEKHHLEKKIEALMCYRSQYKRPYVNKEFISGLANIRGVQSGNSLAEAFEVIRLII